MRFQDQAEKELHELHERHARELWALTRRLLARSHQNGRREGPLPEPLPIVRDSGRDVPGWIREPRRPSSPRRVAVMPVVVPESPTAESRRAAFHLPWSRPRVARSGSGG